MTRSREIFTVSELNREVQQLLQSQFPLLWVEGEISNLATPGSGHIYLSLKDSHAQVKAAMFKNRHRFINFKPANGMLVQVRARIGLYEARGDYQIIIEQMEEAGEGALRRAFEQLKTQLQQEGLFDENNKQTLPEYPQSVGVITSATGAALQDILTVLKRRFSPLSLIIYPTRVQGKEATAEICQAIKTANTRQECGLLLLARGGGSLEDLWPFNEESVARSIFASALPIVTGVGHETDMTIADFVADHRCPTPSAAAEFISPDGKKLLEQLREFHLSLTRNIHQLIQKHKKELTWISKQIIRPDRRLQEFTQRFDDLEARLTHNIDNKLSQTQKELQGVKAELLGQHPKQQINRLSPVVAGLYKRLSQEIKNQLEIKKQHLQFNTQQLNTVSPLATLGRGYAIAQKEKQIIRSAKNLNKGDLITLQLGQGSATSKIISTKT